MAGFARNNPEIEERFARDFCEGAAQPFEKRVGFLVS